MDTRNTADTGSSGFGKRTGFSSGSRIAPLLLGLSALLLHPVAAAGEPLTGNWEGRWTSADEGSGVLTMSLTQTGTSIAGQMSVFSTSCGNFENLPVSGTSSTNGAFVSFEASATCSQDGSQNTLEFTQGAFADNRIDGSYGLISDGELWDSGSFFLTRSTNLITATATSGGTIAPAGVVPVSAGSSRAFSIAPTEGFEISDVLVDGTSVGAVTSYEFSSVGANHTIQAGFGIAPDPELTPEELSVLLMLLGNDSGPEPEQ